MAAINDVYQRPPIDEEREAAAVENAKYIANLSGNNVGEIVSRQTTPEVYMGPEQAYGQIMENGSFVYGRRLDKLQNEFDLAV